jgi:hypothetical protein
MRNFYNYVVERLKKTLGRRSQKGAITWEKMEKILKHYPLVRPKIKVSLW